MRRRAIVLIVLSAALLAACGEDTIKADGAEQSVVDVVSKKTGFRPTDVSCPSGVKAEVGGVFECQFTGPEGKPYTARMKITKVDGERVVVAVMARVSGEERRANLARDVAGAVRETVAVDCDVVLVAPSVGLPTTSSGKLSRARAKANYLAGLYAPKPAAA